MENMQSIGSRFELVDVRSKADRVLNGLLLGARTLLVMLFSIAPP